MFDINRILENKWVFVIDHYWKKSIIDKKPIFKAVNARIECFWPKIRKIQKNSGELYKNQSFIFSVIDLPKKLWFWDISTENHPKMGQKDHLDRTFLLSLMRSIDWYMIWLYMMNIFYGHFIPQGGFTLENDQEFKSYQSIDLITRESYYALG